MPRKKNEGLHFLKKVAVQNKFEILLLNDANNIGEH